MLIFGLQETSDSWVDAVQLWWNHVRDRFAHIKRLVIYLDNGPNNSGRRTQFLKRMVQFADWSGLEVRLVYYPPYHSKYNPVERCWSALERKWSGVLLNCVRFVLECARRMTWNGKHPEIQELQGEYPLGVQTGPVLIFVSGADWNAISSGWLAAGPRRGLRSGLGPISSCGPALSTSSMPR